MRTTRILLAALALALFSACSAEQGGPVSPARPAFDGVGLDGSGNSIGADTTSTTLSERCGIGTCGSGN
ncbi:MAG TPA: hypothetical protein VGR37_12970 [Longimicrobiaceae bacterium]|nr:hypothetical protein [Longimicrobiaceae bacterium]